MGIGLASTSAIAAAALEEPAQRRRRQRRRACVAAGGVALLLCSSSMHSESTASSSTPTAWSCVQTGQSHVPASALTTQMLTNGAAVAKSPSHGHSARVMLRQRPAGETSMDYREARAGGMMAALLSAPISYWTGRRTRSLRSRNSAMRQPVVFIAVAAVCILAFRNPAWASGGGGPPPAQLAGPLAARVLLYHNIFGSLYADIVVAITCFVVFGVCAGSETAITTLWPWKVRELAQKEDKKGMWTALRQDIQRFMQTILVGATVSGVMSTAIITQICGQLFGQKGLAIATASATMGQLIFCEIIPKSVAVSNAYRFAKTTLPMFYGISFFLYPLSRVVNRLVELLLGLFRIEVDANKTPYVSEEELDLIFQSAMKSGIVDTEEGEMIRSVRNLDSQSVKDVMTPLVDVVGIEGNSLVSELLTLCLETQHSRIPVYNDRFDSIVGVVSMKALLKNAKSLTGEASPLTVEQIMDEPYFVPETMSCLNLLQKLKEKTLAIAVDEYGGTTGLATLEDVLEEIVGDIYDPDDREDKRDRTRNKTEITDLGNGRYTMAATAEVKDVSDELGVSLPEGDYNSIGGFMCQQLDHIPVLCEAVTVKTKLGGVKFVITEVDDRKVLVVEATKDYEDDDEGSDQESHDSDEEEDRIKVIDVIVEELSQGCPERSDNDLPIGEKQENVPAIVKIQSEAKPTEDGKEKSGGTDSAPADKKE